MGTYTFRLPDIGEGIAEAEIVAWHVEVGQAIEEDQPLVDVMTDKATVEIGAPVGGTILSRRGEAGAMAAIGSELVVIATADADAAEPGKAPPRQPDLPTEPAPAKPLPAEDTNGTAVARPSASAPAPGPARPAQAGAPKPTAAPAVRARAAALGVDLEALAGTGPDGRIVHADLDTVLLARQAPAVDAAPPAPAIRAAKTMREGVEEVPVIGLRRQIAQRMQDAMRRIPHFSYVEEVDVTALEALRAELNRTADPGQPRLTVLPFLIRALARVLPGHPGVNAHFDDAAGVIHRHAALHAGIATQTPRGLLVPVIRHAEALDPWQIAGEIARLSEAARAGKSSRDELAGSTITVTSLGALGGLAATPIVNPPEVAIVGVNKIVERPVVRDGRIVVARMMNLSSSFDHRIVDGFDAAAFIQALKLALEAPARLLVG